jgi:hypothetical protein
MQFAAEGYLRKHVAEGLCYDYIKIIVQYNIEHHVLVYATCYIGLLFI